MSARIKIVSGPDEGLEVAFGVAEVRIGRGAGFNVPLTDDALTGQLRVWFEKGTYVVRSELQSPGYFLPPEGVEGYDEFHPGEQKVWFHGSRVQPTQSTVLTLTIEDGVRIPDGKIEITRPTDTTTNKKSRDQANIIIIGVLLLAAVGLFLIPSDIDGPVKDGPISYKSVEEKLDAESKPAKKTQDERAYRTVRAVHDHLKEARFLELYRRPGAAYRRYGYARDELNRALGGTDENAELPRPMPEDTVIALREARAYVNDRLVKLAPAPAKTE